MKRKGDYVTDENHELGLRTAAENLDKTRHFLDGY